MDWWIVLLTSRSRTWFGFVGDVGNGSSLALFHISEHGMHFWMALPLGNGQSPIFPTVKLGDYDFVKVLVQITKFMIRGAFIIFFSFFFLFSCRVKFNLGEEPWRHELNSVLSTMAQLLVIFHQPPHDFCVNTVPYFAFVFRLKGTRQEDRRCLMLCMIQIKLGTLLPS